MDSPQARVNPKGYPLSSSGWPKEGPRRGEAPCIAAAAWGKIGLRVRVKVFRVRFRVRVNS